MKQRIQNGREHKAKQAFIAVCVRVCTKNNYTYVVGGWLIEPTEALGC